MPNVFTILKKIFVLKIVQLYKLFCNMSLNLGRLNIFCTCRSKCVSKILMKVVQKSMLNNNKNLSAKYWWTLCIQCEQLGNFIGSLAKINLAISLFVLIHCLWCWRNLSFWATYIDVWKFNSGHTVCFARFLLANIMGKQHF